jgi:ubiquinone/menaquinone biosynthesis C-methylase UbiE
MFSDPDQNLEQFGLSEHMNVADLGAGSGAYTIAAARRVRNFGKVYAVEVQKELAVRAKNAASKAGFSNVEAIWGDIERRGGTELGDGTMDAVIISNVLFQLEHKEGMIAETDRILKPGGKVLVIDWKESYGGMGPTPGVVIPADVAKELFVSHGFTFEKEINAGVHHYGFIVRKQGGGRAGLSFVNNQAGH